ncbi:MAG TPA: molybdate ABC transporter substrate-binding protein [Candidatus Dormibacteraeota bacterium]|nr:molybdate ABC transporter substrate-binding protein [Candidatus Dormibacteraeota bacterium]
MTRSKIYWRAWLASSALLITLSFGSTGLWGQEQKIRVAAAADLKFAMDELSNEFASKKGIRVDVTSGSSGNFFAQIQSGAPFDLFFSADMEYPKKLEAGGFTEPGTLYEYALGRIVICTPAGAEVDVAKRGWSALLDTRVQKIAIANPAFAPYGRAAVTALQKAGIYERVKNKLVYGENISQAAQFVQSENAQTGIIAHSLALSPGMKKGTVWEIPVEMYPPIEQGAVLLKNAKNKAAALAFLDFVKSVQGRGILERNGFAIPASN